jgi:hypothetical protein
MAEDSWRGFEVEDVDGRRVGVVHGVFADSASAEPVWLLVALGRRRAKLVAVPLRDCAGAAGKVWTAHRRDRLRSAPGIDPTRPLLREHELVICEHLGIGKRVGRSAEVVGREPGSAVSGPPQRR